MDDVIFGNRYRLIEKIGTGGMADVYKAIDEVLGRTVAVKIMHPHYAEDPVFVQRFRHEAQSAANLSHPNIVNIYDWGQQDNTYFIVMEYVRGVDIKDLIAERGPIDPAKAANYAAQVAAALSAAHRYGIIHRDIKSHNLVLTNDDTIKVMDFGIARTVNSTMTQTGSVLGTAQYVSPEQAQGRELTPGTDLYSLGVVLYEMTTGRLPFESDTPVSVALKHVNEQAVPPRQIDPKIPPAVEAIIMHAMDKDPSRRYASAEEMRSDLIRASEGRPVESAPRIDNTMVMPTVGQTRPAGESRRQQPKRKPRSAWIWAGVLVLLIALGLGIAYGVGLFPGKIHVPDVVGKKLADAQFALVDAGLVAGDIVNRPGNEGDKGNVIDTDPKIGTPVAKGSTVKLIVSTGPKLVPVPDVIGQDRNAAGKAMQEANLFFEVKDEFSSKPANTVIRVDPPVGQQVPVGSNVILTVSQGREEADVPWVIGKTKSEASQALDRAGFVVRERSDSSTSTPVGSVTRQDPNGGTAPKGSKVTIWVSSGPKKVSVPNLINMSESEAKAALDELGLGYTFQYEAIADPAKFGKVFDQYPAAGTVRMQGEGDPVIVGIGKA